MAHETHTKKRRSSLSSGKKIFKNQLRIDKVIAMSLVYYFFGDTHSHSHTHTHILCSKKCDHIFNAKFVRLQKLFAHLLLRSSTGVLIFPTHLFHAPTLAWETVET